MHKRETHHRQITLIVLLSWFALACAAQADTKNDRLPLATISDISGNYRGSFKVDHADGVSSTRYIQGRIAYNASNHSIFIDSNHRDDAVAEFAVPDTLSFSDSLGDLPEATVIQEYRRLFADAVTGNPHGIDKIGGMYMIGDELFVQAYETYDASGKNPHTTLVVRQPDSLETSAVDGFFEMDGAARTSMYISPVPREWQDAFGGEWIAGMGAGMSINGRFSEGPSLYIFDPADFEGKSKGRIKTKKFLDYPSNRPLSISLYNKPGTASWDSYNDSGKNLLWTQASAARYAFIIPGTRTYAVIGNSGALEHAGGYKILNDEGYRCPGPCAYDNQDYHTYYWLYDLDDILSAKDSHDPIPYDYGIFDDRFLSYNKQGAVGKISGGSFDPNSGQLFLSRASVGERGGIPVVSVYQVKRR